MDYTDGNEFGKFVFCTHCNHLMLLPEGTKECKTCDATLENGLIYGFEKTDVVELANYRSSDLQRKGFLLMKVIKEFPPMVIV